VNRILRSLVVALAGAGALLAADAPGAFTSAEARALDRVALAELKASGAPGMVLAVLRGDRVAYLKAYGSANAETGEAMDSGRLASVASLTKLVTAATAVTLAAEGKLDLRAPIRDQLPGLPERVGLLTMAQLHSHTSGLSESARPALAPGGDGSLLAVGKGFKEVFLSDPGTVWSYCNAGYTLAGQFLETDDARRIAGHEQHPQPWPQHAQAIAQLPAVQPWHDQIGGQQIDGPGRFGRDAQGFAAVGVTAHGFQGVLQDHA